MRLSDPSLALSYSGSSSIEAAVRCPVCVWRSLVSSWRMLDRRCCRDGWVHWNIVWVMLSL